MGIVIGLASWDAGFIAGIITGIIVGVWIPIVVEAWSQRRRKR